MKLSNNNLFASKFSKELELIGYAESKDSQDRFGASCKFLILDGNIRQEICIEFSKRNSAFFNLFLSYYINQFDSWRNFCILALALDFGLKRPPPPDSTLSCSLDVLMEARNIRRFRESRFQIPLSADKYDIYCSTLVSEISQTTSFITSKSDIFSALYDEVGAVLCASDLICVTNLICAEVYFGKPIFDLARLLIKRDSLSNFMFGTINIDTFIELFYVKANQNIGNYELYKRT